MKSIEARKRRNSSPLHQVSTNLIILFPLLDIISGKVCTIIVHYLLLNSVKIKFTTELIVNVINTYIGMANEWQMFRVMLFISPVQFHLACNTAQHAFVRCSRFLGRRLLLPNRLDCLLLLLVNPYVLRKQGHLLSAAHNHPFCRDDIDL